MTPTVLVTDTHPLIWYIAGQHRKLPKQVTEAFDAAVEGSVAIDRTRKLSSSYDGLERSESGPEGALRMLQQPGFAFTASAQGRLRDRRNHLLVPTRDPSPG